jgi:catecholate siderophore receptor
MTRKALRKRLRLSAFVASAAIGASPAAAGVRPSSPGTFLFRADSHGAPLDPRLALVDAAFRRSAMPLPAAYALAQAPSTPPRDPPARRFDIPAGPLSDALPAFERVSGIRITLDLQSIGSLQSPGVTGTFTVSQALSALLGGTGVRARFTSPTAAVLELGAQSESVDVTGRAPGTTIASPKYAGTVRDTPQTIEIIPRAAMEQQGVTTLSEALRNVPGITLQAGEGGGASSTAGDMFNMRGFNAANSLFVDGVRDDGLVSRDVFNLEQVEVFMGPTGSDVGRGTAAGYVNLQTKTPHLESAAAGTLSYGTADQRRITADVNHAIPFRQDGSWLSKSAVRANALWQGSGVPGRDVVELESRAFAPSVALGLETSTRVTASAQIVRQDNQPDYGIPGAAWLDEPLTPTTVRATAPVDQSNYYGSRGYDYDHAAQTSGVVRVEHDLTSRITIRNQTRYNEAHREAVITSIGNPAAFNPATNLVTLSRQGNERRNTILSNQTSLTDRFATGRLQHAASAGVEYTSETQFAPTLGGVGTRAAVDIFNPNPDDPVAGYDVVRTGASTRGRTSTIALYAFDTIELGARWQLNGGFRWEHYDTRYRAVDIAGVATTDERAADELISGKAGLVFKVTRRGNLYVSYGRTVTPPGTANFTLSAQDNNQNNPDVKPQESTNLEAGSKWDLIQGRLLLTGAVFHTVNKNVIFTVDATAVPPLYNQDDGQRVNGVTIGANGSLLAQWQVMANVSYLDTALESQNPVNDGNRLTLTPKLSGGIWTTYRLPRRITLGGGLRFTDAVFINAANTIKSPGYRLVDLLAEYEVNQHLSLRLNVYNLTNEEYIRSLNNNGGRYNPGNPRSGLVASVFKF